MVVVMTDQQRADITAREGYPLDTTPFLDGLAERGVWFDRAYTTAPLCGPARESFLTGRWPQATGVDTNDVSGARYDRDLFDVASEAGYATALIGKNHTHLTPDRVDYWSRYTHGGGTGDDRTAAEREMDEWLSELAHGVATEPAPGPVEATPPARIVDEARDWIRTLDRPFCCWLSIPEPHNPFYAPEPYCSLFPPEELPPRDTDIGDYPGDSTRGTFLRDLQDTAVDDLAGTLDRYRSNYCGTLRLIDDQVERFVSFLEDEGLRENTLLVVTADHGDFVGAYGLQRKGHRTATVLSRIPLVVDGPTVDSSDGAHPAHVSLADLFPTLCEAMGEPLPDGVQGRSLRSLLAGEGYPDEEFRSVYVEGGYGGRPVGPEAVERAAWLPEAIGFHELNPVMQSGRACAVRRGDWKLDVDDGGDWSLYDLDEDPLETTDLSDEAEPDAVRDLLLEMVRWQLRLTDTLGTDSPATPDRHPRNYRWET